MPTLITFQVFICGASADWNRCDDLKCVFTFIVELMEINNNLGELQIQQEEEMRNVLTYELKLKCDIIKNMGQMCERLL